MESEKNFSELHTNQRLLLQELETRGVKIEVLVPELEIVRARYGKHVELLLDRSGSRCPYGSSIIASDKYVTKQLLLQTGLEAPRGEQFYPDQRKDALRYAEAMGFPLVLKPTNGSHGECCFTDIESIEEVEAAIDSFVLAQGPSQPFIIEEQFEGLEYRVFITKYGDFAVLHREPASVTGDGRQSIHELISSENYRRMHPRQGSLCRIVVDDQVRTHLKRQNLSLESVPEAGEKIFLRRNSNVALGGIPVDCTDDAHNSLVRIARHALAVVPGLAYAGVDIISKDVTGGQTSESYRILEINSNPGLHMHESPGEGRGQPVSKYLADVIFPETRYACRDRVPAVGKRKEDKWAA